MDCETTGLAEHDQIIELALIQFEFDGGTGGITSILEKYSGLREPQVPISMEARSVHGIDFSEVAGKNLDECKVRSLFESSSVVIAHNARFDRSFLERLIVGLPACLWLCSLYDLDWSEIGVESRKLDSIANHFNIHPKVTHRAFADAMTLLAILNKRDISGCRILKLLLQHSYNLNKNLFAISPNWPEPVALRSSRIHPSAFKKLQNEDGVVLWTKDHLDFINAYHFSAIAGGPPALRFLKSENPELTASLDEDHEAHLTVCEFNGNRVTFNFVRHVRERFEPAALHEYHEIRNKNRALAAEAKSLEKSDASTAIDLYIQAIGQVDKYANLQVRIGVSRAINEQSRAANGVSGDVEILDRLTITLCRVGRSAEALEFANRYFSLYKLDLFSPIGDRILKRVIKNNMKPRSK